MEKEEKRKKNESDREGEMSRIERVTLRNKCFSSICFYQQVDNDVRNINENNESKGERKKRDR